MNLINVPHYVPSDTDSIVRCVLNELLDTVSNAISITEDNCNKSIHSIESFKSVHSNESLNFYDDGVSSGNDETSSDSQSSISVTSVDDDDCNEFDKSTADPNTEINENYNKSAEISSNPNQILNDQQTLDPISSTPSKQTDVGSNKKINITEPDISVSDDDSPNTLSVSDIISNFSKELSNKDYEIFQLRHWIETLETEKFEGRFVPNERRELDNLKNENLELKNVITRQDLAIRDLERREESTLERLNLAHEEVECLRSGLDELKNQLHLRPDQIHDKNKQVIALKDKQLDEKIRLNNELKTALSNINKEKLNLTKNISELSNSCINKKLLAIALEENETLNKQLELSERKIKNALPPGEMELNKLKDENSYFKQTIKDLENEIKKYQKNSFSPKKDTSQMKNRQTRIFEPTNVISNNYVHHPKIVESRGPCRYFPKCKWGDNCKWEHPKNIANHKPRTYNSVPQNQQRIQQNQYPQRPIFNSQNPKQHVPYPGNVNVNKPPPPLQNPPPYNPHYYQTGNPQMMMNDSLPNQFSATFSPQYSVVPENCNLINIPIVPCNEMYNV